jgi:formylglycine-generating enzyme required for sulfatase activity
MKRRMFFLPITITLLITASTFGVGAEAADKAFTSPAIGAQFVFIPAGTFMMGDTIRHQVVIGKPFYMQTTEVTQGQWRKIMGNNPSSFKDCGNDCPVENVSWGDAQASGVLIKQRGITSIASPQRRNGSLPAVQGPP